MTMMTVVMDKVVTVMKELGGSKSSVFTVKYKDLASVLANEAKIEAVYIFGQASRRVKLLEQLGYSLKETIYYNDDAPYAKIRQVWERA
jgi:hypothetical protein